MATTLIMGIPMSPHVVEVWNIVLRHGPSNSGQVIGLDPEIFKDFAAHDLVALIRAYALVIHETAIIAMDNEENIVRLGAVRVLSKYGFTIVPGYAMPELTLPFGSQFTISKKLPARTKIPRPRNAFIIYRMSKRLEVRAANPNVHNNQISVIIGRMWQAETANARSYFKQLAEEEKEEHLRLHPDYRYQPRKPSEKKRRISKKKAGAAVVQQNAPVHLINPYLSTNLHGNLEETRSARLPLSNAAYSHITWDNNTLASTELTDGFGLGESIQYNVAQSSDMDLVGKHMGSEFHWEDPDQVGDDPADDQLGESADGFNFALHTNDFTEMVQNKVLDLTEGI